MIRDASAFERLAAADVWIFDHHSALERGGLEVDRIEGEYENTLLQLAATAFRDIADERAIALLAACRSGGIPLLPIEPSYRGSSIVLDDGATCVTVDDALSLGGTPADSRLYLTASGRTVGRIGFRPASRSRLAAAVEELRRQGGVTVGFFTEGAGRATGTLASELEPDFHQDDLISAAKADLLRSCRDRGLKIAYVGDCRREPQRGPPRPRRNLGGGRISIPSMIPRRSWSCAGTSPGFPRFESYRAPTLAASEPPKARSWCRTFCASPVPSSSDSQAWQPSSSPTSVRGRSTPACRAAPAAR